jgi:hypothetical protein
VHLGANPEKYILQGGTLKEFFAGDKAKYAYFAEGNPFFYCLEVWKVKKSLFIRPIIDSKKLL